jgi:hypothetical protein
MSLAGRSAGYAEVQQHGDVAGRQIGDAVVSVRLDGETAEGQGAFPASFPAFGQRVEIHIRFQVHPADLQAALHRRRFAGREFKRLAEGVFAGRLQTDGGKLLGDVGFGFPGSGGAGFPALQPVVGQEFHVGLHPVFQGGGGGGGAAGAQEACGGQ